jgi:hypothetical protein
MVVLMFSRAVFQIPARKKQLKPFRVTANHTPPRPKVSADNQTKLPGVSQQACSIRVGISTSAFDIDKQGTHLNQFQMQSPRSLMSSTKNAQLHIAGVYASIVIVYGLANSRDVKRSYATVPCNDWTPG